MFRIAIALTLLLVAACDDGQKKEANRKVVSLTTEAGQPFHFMPIYEDGVSDVTFRFAWPTNWSRTEGLNPAVPYIGSELILVGGTKDLKPQDLIELYTEKKVRGSLNASVDYVYGELELPIDHMDAVVPIVAELISTPQLDQQWMGRIQQDLMQSQKELNAASATQLWSAARLSVLGDTPLYQSLGLPDVTVIPDVTRDDILDWHTRTMTRTDVTVAVTGAISPEDAGRVIDELMAGLPKGTPHRPMVDLADYSVKTILLHLPEAEKTTLGLMGQLPPTTEAGDELDFLIVNLLSHTNGPLFEAIRTELRATYGMSAGFSNYTRASRPFFIQGEVETEQLAEVRDVTLQAYETFRTSPDFTGFEEMKTRIVAGVEKNVSYVNVTARTMLEFALDRKDPAITPKLHDLFEAVTKEAMTARLDTKFPPAATLMTFAVSPDANALPGACVITSVAQAVNC